MAYRDSLKPGFSIVQTCFRDDHYDGIRVIARACGIPTYMLIDEIFGEFLSRKENLDVIRALESMKATRDVDKKDENMSRADILDRLACGSRLEKLEKRLIKEQKLDYVPNEIKKR